MILLFIDISKVPREELKTLGFALSFQHFPWDLAKVNEWKIIFDPCNILYGEFCINYLEKLVDSQRGGISHS